MPITPSRRRLLLSGLAVLGGLTSPAAQARLTTGRSERRLSFENLHTGDRLESVYRDDHGFRRDGLREIAWVLRDHRANAAHPIDPGLLDLLHDLRGALGTPAPFQVISGYRSPTTNLMLASVSRGVARGSLHTRGLAIDIRIPGIALTRLRDVAMALRRGGVGYYPRSNFVHLDVGRVRTW